MKAAFGLLFLGSLFSGCAGPTTPLGAPWATNSAQLKGGPLSFLSSLFDRPGNPTSIRFSPNHQVLHGRSPLNVRINDAHGIKENYRVIVRHNGIDVTGSFLRRARVSRTPTQLDLYVPAVRIPPTKDHLIEVLYGATGPGDHVTMDTYARYEAPICRAFEVNRIRHTGSFTPPRELLQLIEGLSLDAGLNPALTTGLIAQESAFNPKSVSWARAIGLMQMTPVAEDEVKTEVNNWPRYPGINAFPIPWVKFLIASGHVHAENEWRLDNERSIRGGLAFAVKLASRLSAPENIERIRSTFPDPDIAYTKLLLASYNSGYSRVWGAFSRLGPNWLKAPELNEARRYVNRVFSYCDHFTDSQEIEI